MPHLNAMLVVVMFEELYADVVDVVLRKQCADVLDVCIDLRVVRQNVLSRGLWRRWLLICLRLGAARRLAAAAASRLRDCRL